MEQVLTMANLKLKPYLFTPCPNKHSQHARRTNPKRSILTACYMMCSKVDWIKDLWGNPNPRVSPNRTGLKLVQGQGTFLRIFLGRVGNFIWGRSGSEYFLLGVWDIFPGICGINLHLYEKHIFHSQTERIEWLLSLLSMLLYDVIISLQVVFTCLV